MPTSLRGPQTRPHARVQRHELCLSRSLDERVRRFAVAGWWDQRSHAGDQNALDCRDSSSTWLALAAPVPGIFSSVFYSEIGVSRRPCSATLVILSGESRRAWSSTKDKSWPMICDWNRWAIAPPIRPHTSLAIAVHQYNGRLMLAAPAYDNAVSGPRVRRFARTSGQRSR